MYKIWDKITECLMPMELLEIVTGQVIFITVLCFLITIAVGMMALALEAIKWIIGG